MARKSLSPTSAAPDSPAERLTTAVDHLAQQVRVLTDIVDDIRDDLSWLLRNGVPHQEQVVRVERLPRNPAARKWAGRGRLAPTSGPDDRSESVIPQSGEALDRMIDELVSRLAEPLGEIAQEQLNILLGVLESARKEIATAIRGSNYPAPLLDALMQPSHSGATDSAGREPTERNVPPPGSLF